MDKLRLLSHVTFSWHENNTVMKREFKGRAKKIAKPSTDTLKSNSKYLYLTSLLFSELPNGIFKLMYPNRINVTIQKKPELLGN